MALKEKCLFCILVFFFQNIYSQQTGGCKIGLTLSGGGAKGLAHIGILKAIDSAGLQIDYVTGTSMGAVIGSLYAAGYSGDSIYQIAKAIDWNALLLNKSPLNSFIMELKNEYGRYVVELPMEKGRIKVPSGILEAEELWLKFGELYHPVYNINNFADLPRSFKCIATNIVTGEAVVLNRGSLMDAVRASMSIPSVFTDVNYNDSVKLVDGGIIRNFPVTDVKEMGANIIIGISVNTFSLPQAKDITSPMQILMNVAFFREQEYSQKDVDLCNYLIVLPLSKYSAASFRSSDSIIDLGLQAGREYYPYFKKMADSLKAIYGAPAIKTLPPSSPGTLIRHVVTDSLKYTEKAFLLRMLSIKEGTVYTVKDLESAMRRAYGTRYFSRLYYRLKPVSTGVADLHLVTRELAPASAKLAINYNSLNRIMLIVNLSKRDMIGKQSVSSVTAGISENPRIRFNHTKIMGSSKFPVSSVTEIYAEQQKFLQFRDFKANGNYRQISGYFDTRLQLSYKRKVSYGAGARLQAVVIKSLSETLLDFDGRNYYIQPYLRYEYNTHDRWSLPRKGTWILFEPSAVLSQSQKLTFKTLGIPIGNIDTLGISNTNFIKIRAQLQHVIQWKKRNFITLQAETGINFNSGLLLFHDYVAGGMQPVMRNQVAFAGIRDAALRTNSLAKAAVNWRYHVAGSIFASASANILYHSFLREKYYRDSNKFLSGYGLGIGIDSPIGPIELSFSRCDQAGDVINYLNVGFRISREMF